jgi:Fe-Mn family superoxide dismutase
MKIHLHNHHQGYIDKLNSALESHPALQKLTLKELLHASHLQPKKIREKIADNGGGHYNHSLFWLMMSPQKTEPTGSLLAALQKTFKSVDAFKQKFTQAAISVFGSGWAWLCLDKKKRLIITTTSNQNAPLNHGLIPLLGLDVWEHAYYLKYKNKRAEYIDAWWHVINWPYVQERYDEALRA